MTETGKKKDDFNKKDFAYSFNRISKNYQKNALK
mgnify:CR=1 FL=1